MISNIPEKIIEWVFEQNSSTIVTTSFGDQSAVLLHMVSIINPNANILWVNTQFNSEKTIAFKAKLTERLKLNVIEYKGEQWCAEIPDELSTEYKVFVEQIKLKPFHDAINTLKPKFWISGIRREQTDYRQNLEHIQVKDGITKVSPLLDWSNNDMANYLSKYDLPNETDYNDPTKINLRCECGLHTMTLEKGKV